jgi:hypothetical protein
LFGFGDFFWAWCAVAKGSVLLAFLRGVGEKVVWQTWYFDGELVVGCVLIWWLGTTFSGAEKYANFLRFIFWRR